MKARVPIYKFTNLPEKRQKELRDLAIEQLTEYALDKMGRDIQVAMMYVLYTQCGFGKHRCRKIYDACHDVFVNLRSDWGASNDNEAAEYMRLVLRKAGIDVDYWDDQMKNWNPTDDKCWQSVGHKGRR